MSPPRIDTLCEVAAADGLVVLYVPPIMSGSAYPLFRPAQILVVPDPRKAASK